MKRIKSQSSPPKWISLALALSITAIGIVPFHFRHAQGDDASQEAKHSRDLSAMTSAVGFILASATSSSGAA